MALSILHRKKKNDKEVTWTETHVDKIWWFAIINRKQNNISKKQMILKQGNEPSNKHAGSMFNNAIRSWREKKSFYRLYH